MTGGPDHDERLLSGYTGRLALLLALGWLTVLLGRQALPPLLPTIIAQFEISSTLAGFALTLLMGLYALLHYPAGRLSDALSRPTVLLASVGGMLAGFGLLASTTSYAHLLVAVAVLGVSSAFYFTPSRAYLSDLFVERRGQALGMQSTAGLTGSALAAGVAIGALEFATWQAAFLPPIVILVLVGVLLHRFSDEPYVLRGTTVDLDLRATVGRLLADPDRRRLIAMRALVAFSFQAIVGFLPAFLHFEKGLSTTVAGGVFALFFVVGAATTPLSGWLSDRLARLRVILGGLALGLFGLAGLLLAERVGGVVAMAVLLAVGLLSLIPVVQAYLLDSFPDASMGGDYGAAKTVFTGVGSLGPTYLGAMVSAVGYLLAFASLGPVLLVAVALLVTAPNGE